MLKVVIPGNNIPEREYIIKTLLSDFLGLQYVLAINDAINHYAIYVDDSELVIKDSFFSKYPDDLSYLNTDAIPESTIYAKNVFTTEKDIPVIYGSGEISLIEKKIICGIDIFASSFFMITRWEEYVDKTRDDHIRFPGAKSVAYKSGFLNRPVVNEYVEMLWRLILKLGYKGERKERQFNLVMTHDIDYVEYPMTPRTILGDIFKRRNLNLAKEHLSYYLMSGSNPYDTFGLFMTSSEKLGTKSHFYFMASDSKKMPDTSFYLNKRRFRTRVKEILKRGHIVGFHPGYFTFDDPVKWESERKLLEKKSGNKIVEGRQHYLRFDIPSTFRIWEKNKMEIDSTLGYADNEGFRCGTGDIFTVFDFLERRQMSLKECPLIVMDDTLRRRYSPEKAVTIIQYYFSISRKYNSSITLLFHNSSFYGENWKAYDSLYEKSLEA